MKVQLYICILLSIFLTSACSNEDAQPAKNNTGLSSINVTDIEKQQQKKTAINEAKVLTEQAPENELVILAKKITADYKLNDIKLECLTFELLEQTSDGKRIIDVRELHSENCGGDLNTSPRLFSIAINEGTGDIWSDAKSMLGQLEKLN